MKTYGLYTLEIVRSANHGNNSMLEEWCLDGELIYTAAYSLEEARSIMTLEEVLRSIDMMAFELGKVQGAAEAEAGHGAILNSIGITQENLEKIKKETMAALEKIAGEKVEEAYEAVERRLEVLRDSLEVETKWELHTSTPILVEV